MDLKKPDAVFDTLDPYTAALMRCLEDLVSIYNTKVLYSGADFPVFAAELSSGDYLPKLPHVQGDFWHDIANAAHITAELEKSANIDQGYMINSVYRLFVSEGIDFTRKRITASLRGLSFDDPRLEQRLRKMSMLLSASNSATLHKVAAEAIFNNLIDFVRQMQALGYRLYFCSNF